METEEMMHISDVLKSAVIEIGYKKKAVRDGSGPNKNSYRSLITDDKISSKTIKVS